jgi:hypothetical protein
MRKIAMALTLLMASSTSMAQSFCFAFAETYYEQVYCQLQAKAQTKGLPPFHEFKKNDERVQAALLKRPAERNGIKLPLPKIAVDNQAVVSDKPLKSLRNRVESSGRVVREVVEIQQPETDSNCLLDANNIRCGNLRYKLIGNKSNRYLAKGVLDEDYKMAIPDYAGEPLDQYLSEAYRHYVNKMCDIGLGGVTMTFGKFAYLYRDVQLKGLNFVQRFETMYSFLKKDKAIMAVNEAASRDPGISIGDCSPLDEQRFVCAYKGRNYIFERE